MFNIGDHVLLATSKREGIVERISPKGVPRVRFKGCDQLETVSPHRLVRAKIFRPAVKLKKLAPILRKCAVCGDVGSVKRSQFDESIAHLWCACGNSTTFFLREDT